MIVHFRSLTRSLVVLSLLSITAGVVYYVEPTEPCAHHSSCPSNVTCHTMDHYASNSSHYFSSDHINVTLFFMCGVHNCTPQVDVGDLQIFAMIGTAERQHVTITDNQAHFKGGAIYQSLGGYLSIDSHSILTFRNNSASQGGVLYLPRSATVNVGIDSIVLFANNSALDYRGVVYASVQ